MNDLQPRMVANQIAALAQLLTGKAGRFDGLRDAADLIVGGTRPTAASLMQFRPHVFQSGRPTLWIHNDPELPNMPVIGLASEVMGRFHVIENCMLSLRPNGRRAVLVPDSFKFGSYKFRSDLRLIHSARAPAADYDTGQADIIRAYVRLAEIQTEQWDRGDVFSLPTLVKAA